MKWLHEQCNQLILIGLEELSDSYKAAKAWHVAKILHDSFKKDTYSFLNLAVTAFFKHRLLWSDVECVTQQLKLSKGHKKQMTVFMTLFLSIHMIVENHQFIWVVIFFIQIVSSSNRIYEHWYSVFIKLRHRRIHSISGGFVNEYSTIQMLSL